MKVVQVGRLGPYGQFLDDHLFFDGWDSWGSGVPSPLVALAPASVIASAHVCGSIADLVGVVNSDS
ncbi:hypothetical protein [Actinoplanes sp. NPDC051851]|uniref:hypothetical protein n=1 Tax=Actinoplanes sp. NPDC051851 TaxID=3154753 RepID=UPI003432124D